MMQKAICTIQISDIKVGSRIRKNAGYTASLEESIKRIGLLHPITINEKHELIAGYRRLVSCQNLGWNEISANVINVNNILYGGADENRERVNFSLRDIIEIKREVEKTRINHRPRRGDVQPPLSKRQDT